MRHYIFFLTIILLFSCKGEVEVILQDTVSLNLTGIRNQTAIEKIEFLYDVNESNSNKDVDFYGYPITYSCFVDIVIDGRVTTPTKCSEGLDGFSFNVKTGEMKWTPGYFAHENGASNGIYEIKVLATSSRLTEEGEYDSTEKVFTLTVSQSQPFISTWRIPAPGHVVSLPLRSGYTYDFTVDWGDGSTSRITEHNDSDKEHTYADAGDYVVTITGYAEAWYSFGATASQYRDLIINVENFGTLGWKNLYAAFFQCQNLINFSGGNFSDVTDMNSMFNQARKLISIEGVSGWDTNKVTTMYAMFHNANKIGELDISNWDVSNVETIEHMFSYAYKVKPNVENWDTSKVTNMRSTFDRAYKAQPNVRNWDVSNVKDMKGMFAGRSGSYPIANPDVSLWNTESLESIENMFAYARDARPDLSNWNTSKLKNMKRAFYRNANIEPNVENWDVSQVINMDSAFREATSANPDLSNWDVSKVTNMSNMFRSSGISNTNYSRFLNMAAATADENGVNLRANAKYNAGSVGSRNYLTGTLGWNIVDEGAE